MTGMWDNPFMEVVVALAAFHMQMCVCVCVCARACVQARVTVSLHKLN